MSEVLRWKQPRRMNREFVLLRGSEAVASLNFHSLLSNRATGTYGNKMLELSTEGIFNWRIRVTTKVLGGQAALLRVSQGLHQGADFELLDGRMLRIASKGVFRRSWTLSDKTAGQARNLLALIETRQFFEDASDVVIEDVRSSDPDPLFLAIVTWYFVLIMHQHESAAASGAASAST